MTKTIGQLDNSTILKEMKPKGHNPTLKLICPCSLLIIVTVIEKIVWIFKQQNDLMNPYICKLLHTIY